MPNHPATPALFRCSHVNKTYTVSDVPFHALRDVNLDIYPGEFVAVTGPSGSGKSTLLNLLGTLDTPTDGSLTFSGDELSALDDTALAKMRNQYLGFIFQNFNLMARTNLLQNVALPMVYAGQPLAKRQTRALELLSKVGLETHARKLPSQLSGGQQQRVAIARALANAPKVLLADEPTGNLDSKTGQEIMALMRDLNRTQGVTIIFVTHDPVLSRSADRIIEFADGCIARDTSAKGVMA